MTTIAARRNRAAGSLLGLACGDAAGVPYEFATAPYDPVRGPEMIGGGLGPYAPGEWSDDTQMALCIARAAADAATGAAAADDVAAASAPLDSPEGLDAIARGFLGWLREGATDVGAQTRQVLGAVQGPVRGPGADAADATDASDATDAGIARRMTEAAARLHASTGRTAGNGALMRTAPVALAFLDDPARTARAARAIAELTHTDPLAGDSCVLWCEAIRRSVTTGEPALPEDALDLLPPENRAAWSALEDGSWRAADDGSAPRIGLAPNGFTVTALLAARHALEAALVALAAADGRSSADAGADVGADSHPGAAFRAGIAAAVALGDDTDTIAAITGSLLGAWVGAEGIPPEWTAVVHGWPGVDGPGLRVLAERIVQG
ncbi:ADP-ribosylglycohydrolase family protein [Brachybacterium sp. DNPG3]